MLLILFLSLFKVISAQHFCNNTFGVDKNIKNFKNCGKIFYQVLPQMGEGPSHDVICRRNYYDEDCVECQKPIVDNNEKVELSKENFMIYRY